MKHLTLFAALFLAAASLAAGVTYDFHSDTTGLQQTAIDGSIAVDGPNMKMTVVSGDGMMFKSGSVALSRDGGKTLAVFDPSSKPYYEIRVDAMVSSVTD